MRFLIDTHLPRRVVSWLSAEGCDACHTLDLPDGNQTTDAQIIARADAEQRIVVTKDADFVDSHLLHGRPARLLLISTDNLSNRELEGVVRPLLPAIVRQFMANSFLELGRAGLVIRG